MLRAQEELRRALDIDPSYSDAMFNLAQLMLKSGDIAAANPSSSATSPQTRPPSGPPQPAKRSRIVRRGWRGSLWARSRVNVISNRQFWKPQQQRNAVNLLKFSNYLTFVQELAELRAPKSQQIFVIAT